MKAEELADDKAAVTAKYDALIAAAPKAELHGDLLKSQS
jgi:predicted component of type VI protein secretion system